MSDNQKLTMKLSELDFIVLAPNEWDGQWMNRQQLFSRVGFFTNVIYSTGLSYSWEKRSLSGLLKQIRSKCSYLDNVYVLRPSTLLFRWANCAFYNTYSMKRFVTSLNKKTQPKHKLVLYIFHPRYANYVDFIQHDILVYHPFDDFSKQGIFDQTAKDAEKILMDKADIVITPSGVTSQTLSARYSRPRVETVNNGVDFESFSSAQRKDKANTKSKVAYIGSINVKVDIAALLHLVKSLPEISLELVGPIGVMADKQQLFDELCLHKNVKFWGSKHHSELPAIMANMDCLLMCYDTSPALWAKHSYPLKLNEYLAAQRPVVSCPLTSVPGIIEYLEIAVEPDDWVKHVKKALEDPDRKKIEMGYQYAAKQDWLSRVEQIADLLNPHI
jgi:glycosyltransferase involved in cell wall biosynthesis